MIDICKQLGYEEFVGNERINNDVEFFEKNIYANTSISLSDLTVYEDFNNLTQLTMDLYQNNCENCDIMRIQLLTVFPERFTVPLFNETNNRTEDTEKFIDLCTEVILDTQVRDIDGSVFFNPQEFINFIESKKITNCTQCENKGNELIEEIHSGSGLSLIDEIEIIQNKSNDTNDTNVVYSSVNPDLPTEIIENNFLTGSEIIGIVFACIGLVTTIMIFVFVSIFCFISYSSNKAASSSS